MEKTLKILNELEKNGVIGRYAIGGAMGATFYVEPITTFDLDVFVLLPMQAGLLTLTSLYAALKARGFLPDGECVMIEGVPVQFLPAYNSLIEEALIQAVDIPYGETPTRVLRLEHLAAIAVQTGREKDRLRINIFLTEGSIDHVLLTDILVRHNLAEKWQKWNR